MLKSSNSKVRASAFLVPADAYNTAADAAPSAAPILQSHRRGATPGIPKSALLAPGAAGPDSKLRTPLKASGSCARRMATATHQQQRIARSGTAASAIHGKEFEIITIRSILHASRRNSAGSEATYGQ